ncbi:hypothetical protein F5148DRAFT_1149593 [Russula earlei]|uniref:Uncharacterized protein n=1 Tax=Russula earlei TaxID=71964 RepID=A0ACC0U8H4_9AGAM|nr:hypothetical protein F5148DRAFT_1149593 [Russula earlei]
MPGAVIYAARDRSQSGHGTEQATLAAPPPSPSHGQNEDTREPSLESLWETPELYNLTAPGARKPGQHRRARAGVSEAGRPTPPSYVHDAMRFHDSVIGSEKRRGCTLVALVPRPEQHNA